MGCKLGSAVEGGLLWGDHATELTLLELPNRFPKVFKGPKGGQKTWQFVPPAFLGATGKPPENPKKTLEKP